jgi:hypothetical protein
MSFLRNQPTRVLFCYYLQGLAVRKKPEMKKQRRRLTAVEMKERLANPQGAPLFARQAC